MITHTSDMITYAMVWLMRGDPVSDPRAADKPIPIASGAPQQIGEVLVVSRYDPDLPACFLDEIEYSKYAVPVAHGARVREMRDYTHFYRHNLWLWSPHETVRYTPTLSPKQITDTPPVLGILHVPHGCTAVLMCTRTKGVVGFEVGEWILLQRRVLWKPSGQ